MSTELPEKAALHLALRFWEMRLVADRPRTKRAMQAEAALLAAADMVACCGFAPDGYDIRLVLDEAFHDVGNMPMPGHSRPEWELWRDAMVRHIIAGLAERQPAPQQQGE